MAVMIEHEYLSLDAFMECIQEGLEKNQLFLGFAKEPGDPSPVFETPHCQTSRELIALAEKKLQETDAANCGVFIFSDAELLEYVGCIELTLQEASDIGASYSPN